MNEEGGVVRDVDKAALRQAVRQEMLTFAKDPSLGGRSGYSDLVREQSLALTVGAEEVGDYQGADLCILSRMAGWLVDVYDQGIAFSVLRKRYPRDATGEDLAFRKARGKIIEVIKQSMDKPLKEPEFEELKWLFFLIRPLDVQAGILQRLSWHIKYGDESRMAEVPGNIDQKDFVAFVRNSLPRLENL